MRRRGGERAERKHQPGQRRRRGGRRGGGRSVLTQLAASLSVGHDHGGQDHAAQGCRQVRHLHTHSTGMGVSRHTHERAALVALVAASWPFPSPRSFPPNSSNSSSTGSFVTCSLLSSSLSLSLSLPPSVSLLISLMDLGMGSDQQLLKT